MSKLKLTIDLSKQIEVEALAAFSITLAAKGKGQEVTLVVGVPNDISVNEPEIVGPEKPETQPKKPSKPKSPKAEDAPASTEATPASTEATPASTEATPASTEATPVSTEPKLDRAAIRTAMDPKKEKHQVALIEKLRELMADEPDNITRNVSNLPESKFEEFFAFIQSLD